MGKSDSLSLSRRLLVPGLILGAMLRAAALPLPGTGDVIIWKVWSSAAVHDLTGVYGVGGVPPERRVLRWHGEEMTVDYPPVALAELAAAGHLYRWRHPLFEDSAAFNAAVKLPGVVAETVLVALILTWGRRRFGADAAAWTALAFWLNPAILLDGPVLGYLDAQMAVPAVLAVVSAAIGPPWLAGALAAVAVLTKPQALFVVPVILATLIVRRDGRSGPASYGVIGGHDPQRWQPIAFGIMGAAMASAGVLLPFVFRGAWGNLTQATGRLAKHDMLSANAANVWWIFTWVLRVLDGARYWGWLRALTQPVRILATTRAIELGYPDPRLVGLIIVVVALAWAVWRSRRAVSPAATAALAGWLAYACALFLAQLHENHLYLAVPLFTLAAGLDRRYRTMLWLTSAVFTANLLLFYNLGGQMPRIVERTWTGIDASVLLAFVSVGVFVWMTGQLARTLSRLTP